MPVLSWDEIRNRAMHFQNEWRNETNENAEAKTFWNDFFNVFGISRRRVATFEEAVKIDGNTKFVDLLWKGTLLVEHKSKGKNLDRAYDQATNYFRGIKDRDLPQYVLVSDFVRFRLYDLDNDTIHQFYLEELYKNVQLFNFIAGYEKHEIKPQDPVNTKAAEMMGQLHDSLEKINYTGDDLDTLLVRLVFCLFADDTGIFNKSLFKEFIENNTNEDGTDLALKIQYLFEILDTPVEKRIVNDSIYNEFPYVNGSLFKERLRTAVFTAEMREILLECSRLDWGKISPAIFGSMFQSAMDKEKRRALGAHYTSEENILKLIKPLFLDDLREEFEQIKNRKRNKLPLLEELQQKLARKSFFDPACGSGNFLILAYREIRRLELEILKEINFTKYGVESYQLELSLDFNNIIKCNVSQFYGIEIDSFSAQIAQVALWIVDHQMNIEASLYFGASFARLPLSEHANIANDNSLDVNWGDILDPRDCDYLLGNPPFIGARLMTKEQKDDVKKVFEGTKGFGDLDYVSCWFMKASNYANNHTKVSFVSTNSIVQGQQATLLWEQLFEKGVHINFAYRTFKWNNEATGVAAVYCVIIGFSKKNEKDKKIYENENMITVKQINQYLLDAPTIFIKKRSKPIEDSVPPMMFGSTPIDGGNYLFTKKEMMEIVEKEPLSEKYFRPWIGSKELVNNYQRYCLYLADCPPQDLRNMPYVLKRVEAVRKLRSESSRKNTREAADFPTRLADDRTVNEEILIIPRVTSENRNFIPIGYFEYPAICSDSAFQLVNADKYLFGILNSSMHMAWTKTVCGRLKGDYRYSNTIVYNNFVFPDPTEDQKKAIEKKAQKILDVRNYYTNSTLADLYDSLTTPPDLFKAHQELDNVVEKAYRSKKFENDTDRLSHLFNLYKKMTENQKN